MSRRPRAEEAKIKPFDGTTRLSNSVRPRLATSRDGDEDSWLRFDEYHRAALQRLQTSGADFAIMASNTPHHRFDTITRGIAIPVLSMFDVVAQECARIGASCVLVLGTAVTMASSSLRRAFAARHVEAFGPRRGSDRDAIIELIAKLQRGHEEGAAELLSEISRVRRSRTNSRDRRWFCSRAPSCRWLSQKRSGVRSSRSIRSAI
jgi:aspartate/glutamate racemase